MELAARTPCAPLGQPRQVSSRCGRVLRHARHPTPCAPQAHPEGVTRAFALLGPKAIAALGKSHSAPPQEKRCAVRSTRAPRAERSNGPYAAPRPRGCAEERRARGGQACRRTRLLRDLTRRGCPSAARQRKASSTAPPRDRAPQAAPFAPPGRRGTQTPGLAFSLPTFFWRSKRK